MLQNVPEKQMRRVRSLLAIAWLLLIASLIYDPISPLLTHPDTHWSLLRLDPRVFDPQRCHEVVTVQGQCFIERPYAIATRLFWGVIIGAVICIVFLFGHESWRRICPLSFFSQLPRLSGIQRQKQITNPRTGKIRLEGVKIDSNSWLGRHHILFQFGFLFVGLCLRMLFLDSHRLLLAAFLSATILASIIVGYLFAGKTWCQYICPMGPIEVFYTGPRALWGSPAHEKTTSKITQSMCRTMDETGKEKSACVACKSACFDIDAERSYWDSLQKSERKFFHYGYVGLVIAFYLYYILYAGDLDYFYSGAWTHDTEQVQRLFTPGFHLFNIPIPIPRLIAVPLTFAAFTFGSYGSLCRLEKAYKAYCLHHDREFSAAKVRHHVFSLSTFVTFNFLFSVGTHSTLELFPEWLEWSLQALVPLLSAAWLYRTWNRSLSLYHKESVASSLRRQLSKLEFDFTEFLEGRSLEDLKAEEVYVLAKVLPGFSQESKVRVYEGILREMLEKKMTGSQESLELLTQVRVSLGIEEEVHFRLLSELGETYLELLYGDRPLMPMSSLSTSSDSAFLASRT
ncbi:4Fe-4S binding protein [Roseofilum sp. BLCC_M91]|uniref:4Fe-4S binding protein n=1 Tax=Roseofilum halophilum BLCC-M91 TaxID=3022259 RepID=A0ABT7BMD7_9CYAN|nr:4Fe-4S binding protein [Roseofilum halophilum]MDJ1179631.1 4Fe-4S binding protein [Roseofilum halophilum BLCC-M91]